ncbi:hypothetical protein, conserved [Eimeria brunetti]|uniref:CRAL-TRIO domain-containing protein n=1 Tax=Eimeria brunetti TaxID=51314 RepID=U6LNT8_9EIME|nr:hypothetical protein, conserved [Eimeria brunetti]
MSLSPSPSPVSAGSDNSTDCFQDAVSQQLSLDGAVQDTSLIPGEALAYTPQQSEILKPNPGGRPVRLIFGNLDLLPYELEGLSAVRREMEHDKDLRESPVFADERYTLRFLQGNDWDTARCIADMKRHLEWRAKNLPTHRVAVEHLLEQLHVYLAVPTLPGGNRSTLDTNAVFVAFDTNREVGSIPAHSLERHLFSAYISVSVSEFTLEKLLVKNRVEQWRVVVDLEDCSITSTPIGILKQVCDTLTDELLASVNRNQIEERYGGTCSNVSDFSWPVMPPGPFGG